MRQVFQRSRDMEKQMQKAMHDQWAAEARSKMRIQETTRQAMELRSDIEVRDVMINEALNTLMAEHEQSKHLARAYENERRKVQKLTFPQGTFAHL